MKSFIKSLLPPFILNVLILLKQQKYGWTGHYNSWEEARKKSIGYDSDKILKSVEESLLKVKNGEAVYERDSVIFDEIQYSWQLLSGLMLIASKSYNRLNIIDFGGSLGSTYYQNKKFLDELDMVSWNIVEQKHFVEIGKEKFEDERLKFYYDIESCFKEKRPNALLLSSVLQYLENPFDELERFMSYDFEYIIIDLTPFSHKDKERITIQKVPPSIYQAEYPCWIFSLDKIKSILLKKYILIEEFICIEDWKIYLTNKDYAVYRGMILKRKLNHGKK